MFNWITAYQTATPQTKYFVLTWAVYGLAIAVTTAYCYARLDYVRSYKAPPPEHHEISNFKSISGQ